MIWYNVFRETMRPWKFNPQYPAKALIGREIARSASSVAICCAYDVMVGMLFDLGYLTYDSSTYSQGISDLMRGGGAWEAVVANVHVLPAVLVWSDFHFYWVHRLQHESRWLYKHVHKVHHESSNPDPWSGLSFHPIEGALYFSSLLIVLVAPLKRWEFELFRIGLLVAPIFGHIGFGIESFPWGYDHYIHHSKFNYNFGSGLFPYNGIWDNLCGTGYWEGSKATTLRMQTALAQAGAVKTNLD